MKKLILPIPIVLISVLFSLPVWAKNPQDIQLNCPNISSTLRFAGEGKVEFGNSIAYSVCKSEKWNSKVANTIVNLGGDVHIGLPQNLPEDLSDPNIPDKTRLSPVKTEDLLVGDGGKIYFWGLPWEQGSSGDPYVQYKAKLGNCYLNLWGAVQNDLDIYFKTDVVLPDWKPPADFMVEKLSVAAKEIEGKIAEECGAKNVIDNASKNQTEILKPGPSLLSTGYKWLESLYFSKLANVVKEFEVRGVEAQQSPEFREREDLLKEEMLNELKQDPQDSPYRVDILNGQVQIKFPGQNGWSDLKQGDNIPTGSTIFTGMDTTTVLSIQGKGVLQILPFTEITISEQGIEQASEEKKTTTEINLNTGEIEVNIESGVYTAPLMQIYTTNVVAGVRGTHFWVNHNKDKKLSTVGVYQGQVEVKASGSDQVILVSPNGDKQGFILVAQKLSPVKLGIAGAVVIILIIGAIWLIKMKNLPKLGNTGRKKR